MIKKLGELISTLVTLLQTLIGSGMKINNGEINNHNLLWDIPTWWTYIETLLAELTCWTYIQILFAELISLPYSLTLKTLIGWTYIHYCNII